MALKDVFKVSRKTFFNPSGWLGYDMLASSTRTIWDTVKDLFTPATPDRSETFEQAMERQQINEADLAEISQRYFIFACIFGVLGLLAVFSSFYLLVRHASFAGWTLALATAALFFAYGFRYHFWHFQIKHRKLGCTFEEWWQGKPYENKEPKE